MLLPLQTAIMAVADAVEAYREELLDLIDGSGPSQPASSLLGQLLLKAASNDKRFIVEEAQHSLSLLSSQARPATAVSINVRCIAAC